MVLQLHNLFFYAISLLKKAKDTEDLAWDAPRIPLLRGLAEEI